MELGVGAGTKDGAGVEDFVAGMEESDLGADGFDDAGAIEAEDFGLRLGSLLPHADLRVDGIDGDGADGDKEIAVLALGSGEFEIEEGFRIGRGQGLDVADGFHDDSLREGCLRRVGGCA
jgi:hypothetical protein